MFDYTICSCVDSELFKKQCTALELNIPGLQKFPLLEDVDGSIVQKYEHAKGKVIVKNDCQVDALYVLSDFDLSIYF